MLVGGGKQTALLALLLLHRGGVVSSDSLVDELWGESPPPTAAKIVQNYVSNLRRALEEAGSPDGVILTRGPGYMLRVEAGQVDLDRFERLLDKGVRALDEGETEEAARKLREALGLWRGPALADFTYEPFAQAAIARLEELRLAALERRIEADLALGRHGELVGELKELVENHPLRERLRGQLMIALYRSGRQAEALTSYQEARRALVEELGIDPSPELQKLEGAILRQEVPLEPVPKPPARVAGGATAAETPTSERSILIVAKDGDDFSPLIELAERLAASRSPGELLLVRIVARSAHASDELAAATGELRERRDALLARGVAARVAAFTSADPAEDVLRLASEQDVELLLLATPLDEDIRHGTLGAVLGSAPCDVALLTGPGDRPHGLGPDRPVVVPFGAAEHDWAALELGAWLARSHEASMRLLGAQADLGKNARDASRLLADASMLVQRLSGVVPEPLLVPPGPHGVAGAASKAGILVAGLSERWRKEGVGEARLAMAAAAPTVFVRGGLRPGGLAPRESVTRFTWSLARGGFGP